MATTAELPEDRIAEENPDMPLQFIRDILLARNEESIPFEFGES